jgi:hypothetical protein
MQWFLEKEVDGMVEQCDIFEKKREDGVIKEEYS